jgi:twinkle protein
MVRAWARERRIHVWIVAHPQKLQRIKETQALPIPTPDSISGSVHWWNKADCAITVHRDLAQPDKPEVDIYVQKVRFKHVGRVGKATLLYDRVTGRYHSTSKPMGTIKGMD